MKTEKEIISNAVEALKQAEVRVLTYRHESIDSKELAKVNTILLNAIHDIELINTNSFEHSPEY